MIFEESAERKSLNKRCSVIWMRSLMKIIDKTLWVVSGNVRFSNTSDGFLLLDFERDMYCELALLAAAVWLLIEWTPAGITVKEIVDLLETAAPLPRRILETETCRLVSSLARKGFVQKRPSGESVGEGKNAQEQPAGDGLHRL